MAEVGPRCYFPKCHLHARFYFGGSISCFTILITSLVWWLDCVKILRMLRDSFIGFLRKADRKRRVWYVRLAKDKWRGKKGNNLRWSMVEWHAWKHFGDALMYARKIELWLYVAIYSEGGGGEGVRVMWFPVPRGEVWPPNTSWRQGKMP